MRTTIKIITFTLLLMIVAMACNKSSNLNDEIIDENATKKDNEYKDNELEDLYFPYIYDYENNGLEDPNLPSINYEDNELTGTVAYKRCPPQGLDPVMPLSGIQFPQGEAYLFKDSVSEEMITKLKNYWIMVFDSKTDMAGFYTIKLPISGIICNFPDFAKAWDIPEDGCKVYFEGLTYQSSYGGITYGLQFDYVLTNLKRE